MATGQCHPLSKSDCDMNFLHYWGILVAWGCLVEWKQLLWGVGRVNVVHLPKVCSKCQIYVLQIVENEADTASQAVDGHRSDRVAWMLRAEAVLYIPIQTKTHINFLSRRRYHVGIRYWVERKEQLWAVQAVRRQDRCSSSPQIVQNVGNMTFPSWRGIQGQCFLSGMETTASKLLFKITTCLDCPVIRLDHRHFKSDLLDLLVCLIEEFNTQIVGGKGSLW